MSAPLFTVLMPTHNRVDVVGFAIESVLRQTLDDFELIVAGDGCTDSTADLVSGIPDPRLIWRDLPKAPNFGYANRNVAMRAARGRLVAYCAHDDLLFPDHLERMAAMLESGAKPWAYSQPLWVSSDGIMAPIPGDLRQADVARDFYRRNFIPLSNVAHTRALFDKIGGWPEDAISAGDWSMWKAMLDCIEPGAIGYDRAPTMMHFRANWKTRRDSHQPELAAALFVADSAWWPTALKLASISGKPLQAVAVRAMRPRAMIEIREGCASVLEHFARALVRDLLPAALAAPGDDHADGREGRETDTLTPVREVASDLLAHFDMLRGLVRRAVTAGSGDGKMLNDRELIAASGLFDAAWYLERYPDIREAGVDPLEHFCHQGWRDGRWPGPYFDTASILARRPDLLSHGINPLVHYLRSALGEKPGRPP